MDVARGAALPGQQVQKRTVAWRVLKAVSNEEIALLQQI